MYKCTQWWLTRMHICQKLCVLLYVYECFHSQEPVGSLRTVQCGELGFFIITSAIPWPQGSLLLVLWTQTRYFPTGTVAPQLWNMVNKGIEWFWGFGESLWVSVLHGVGPMVNKCLVNVSLEGSFSFQWMVLVLGNFLSGLSYVESFAQLMVLF